MLFPMRYAILMPRKESEVTGLNDLQIEYFLAVADNLSFTKTAAEKYVSQPAISKQIAAMEEELGVLLFERAYKSTKLTEAGKLFADFYRKQRKDLSAITQKAKETAGAKNIPLRIGSAPCWTLTDFLPAVMKQLETHRPPIQITLESYGFQQLTGSLNEDVIDIAITLPAHVPSIPTLEVHTLTEVPRLLIYSRNHPLSQRGGLGPADFKDEVFLVPYPDEASFIIDLVKSFCEPYGFVPKIRPLRNVESLLINVLNGLGVAIVDEWLLHMLGEKPLHIRLNTDHAIVIAWKKNNSNSALPLFLHAMAEQFYPNGGSSFDPL